MSASGDGTAAAVLAELTSNAQAVRSQAPGGDLGQLDAQDSPLNALSSAGFGYVRGMVSFLEEPLKQLEGNSGAVTSAARNSQSAGDQLSSIAGSYRASVSQQTTNWTGSAAEGYRAAGTRHADGIAALGQAATTLSSAMTGAGAMVAQTAQGVRSDITEAVGLMLPILTQARAQAAATKGASLARAIPRCVQIAETYGWRIVARMKDLLAKGLNLKSLVDRTTEGIENLKQAIQHTGGDTGQKPTGQDKPDSGTSDSGKTGAQTSGPQNSHQSAADSTGDTSTQTSGYDTSPSDSTDSSSQTSTPDSTGTGTDNFTDNSPLGTDGTSTPSNSLLDSGTSLPSSLSSTGPGDNTSSVSGALGGAALLGLPGSGGVGGSRGNSTTGSRATTKSASGTTEPGMYGGTGAGGARRGDSDTEHRSPGWLHDKNGLFEAGEAATPAVIDRAPDAEDHEDEATPARRRSPSTTRPRHPIEPPKTPATAQPATAQREQNQEAEPVKLVWRLDENGELEAVPATEQPGHR